MLHLMKFQMCSGGWRQNGPQVQHVQMQHPAHTRTQIASRADVETSLNLLLLLK